MSDFGVWPAGLNYRPFRQGYKWNPHEPQSRTPMEQGPARKRRRWVDSPAYVQLSWPLSTRHFEAFRLWHHLQLADGSLWFRMPVWCGNSFETLPVKFKGAYQPEPRGIGWHIGAELEVRQVPYLDPEDDADLLVRTWPESINPLPLRDAYRLTPHRPVLRGDLDGPQDTRQWFDDTVAAAEYRWSMSADEFVWFRSWYHHGLKDGVAWFSAPVLVGGDFGTRRCRIENAFEAELQLDGTWLVTATIEVREVPYLADGAIYIETMLGEDVLVAAVGSIHHFVHETYPEATT